MKHTPTGILGRAGTLPILAFLLRKHEARFNELITELEIPRRTAAVRLEELRKLNMIRYDMRKNGDGKGYNVYVLSDFGSRIANRMGIQLINSLIEADRSLRIQAANA